MLYSLFCTLLAAAAVTTACVIPPGTLSNTITTGFGVLVQNPAFPVIHDRYMNLDAAGGGDQHLFLDPVGARTFNLVLNAGVLAQNIIHAVINGEYSAVDNTTKMFMTERGDPKASFQPVYGCNPDNDALQVQLAFVTREQSPVGGLICVRVASGNRGYEFRYSPPNNPAFDPTNPCMPVTMVLVTSGSVVTTVPTKTTIPTTTATSTTTKPTTTNPTTATTAPTSTATNLPYTDMTAKGYAFVGCSPEQRRATDGPGRTLSGALYADDAMTNGKCMDFCTSKGYAFAGTEYRRECWCGNSVAPGRQPGTTVASLAGCSFKCGGDTTQYCGGDSWLSLYKKCAVGGPCVNAVFT